MNIYLLLLRRSALQLVFVSFVNLQPLVSTRSSHVPYHYVCSSMFYILIAKFFLSFYIISMFLLNVISSGEISFYFSRFDRFFLFFCSFPTKTTYRNKNSIGY
ncbi:hypothetical protein EDC01DRAFT_678264 [Geopyxis carbonaria]|nr:hypothetical protein EDC01DRAFT_678264 [Geopyxis carbonaria]